MSLTEAQRIKKHFERYRPSTIRGANLKTYRQAVQTIRQHAKRNPGTRSPGRVIYGRVLTIYAQKTQHHVCDDDCKDFKHCYYHNFKMGAVMYGLPNGDILIRSNRK